MRIFRHKTVKILALATGIILFLAAGVFIAINTDYVQNLIRKKVVAELSDRLHTKVEVASLSFRPFSSVALHGVYLEDQMRDTLLYVNELSVNLNMWTLLSKKVDVSSATLRRFNVYLKTDSAGRSNFDFVIKAFASTDTIPKPMNLTVGVKKLMLYDGHFRLTAINKPKKNGFDAAHLDVQHLGLSLTVNRFTADTLTGKINALHFKEQSGLEVKDLQAVFSGNKKQLFLPSLTLLMPESKLNMDSVRFTYNALSNIKKFTQKVQIDCTIQPSDIGLHDLACFVPALKHINNHYRFAANLNGTVSNLRCKTLTLKGTNGFDFAGNFDINGLPDVDNTYVYAQVKDLTVSPAHVQDFIAGLSGQPFSLPQEVLRLGNVNFKGSLTGFFSEMVAYGNFATKLGDISTDMKLAFTQNLNRLTYSGTVKTTGFKLGEMLGNQADFGDVTFQATVSGKNEQHKPMLLNAKATVAALTYKNYMYKNFNFDGIFDGTKFNGKAGIQDENIDLALSGLIDISKKRPVFQGSATVNKLYPGKLNLMKNYPALSCGFSINANLEGDLMKDANGTVALHNVWMQNNDDKFAMDSLTIDAQPGNKSGNTLSITSSLLSVNFQGSYNFIKLPADITHILAYYLPSAIAFSGKGYKPVNNFQFQMNIDANQLQRLTTLLNLSLQMGKGVVAEGAVNAETNKLNLQVDIPDLISKKSHFTTINLTCTTLDDKLSLSLNSMLQQKKDRLNLTASATAFQDSVNTRLAWHNSAQEAFEGELIAASKCENKDNTLWIYSSVLPTRIIINDSTWNVRPGNISTDLKSVRIDRFNIERNRQHLYIDGTVSSLQSDSLNADINSIQLEALCRFINLENPFFQGNASGKVSIRSVLRQPLAQADLVVKGFGMNHSVWGDTYATSYWDAVNQRINAQAIVINNKDTLVKMAGGYYPSFDSLAFYGTANQLPIDFLSPYLSGFLSKSKGLGSGRVNIIGPSKSFWFDADVAVKNAEIGIGSLKTSYFFSDTVHMRKGTIALNNVTVRDAENNTGQVTCLVTNQNLKNWKYTVTVNTNNILALNTKETDNDNFWGKVYAGGTVRITGDDKTTQININATTQPKTVVSSSIGGAMNAASNSFVDYIVKNNYANNAIDSSAQPSPPAHTTLMNATINVTPDAQMQIIIDPKAGDRITATGAGILNLTFNLNTFDMQMRGSYTINSGIYKFTFQNALNREFKIANGSVIRWNGPMTNPQIDINAHYQTTASLADLNTDLSQTNRSSVLVECLLNLSGNLLHPDIKFDINLPNASEEVKQLVKSVINTDEMMNRQIVYLIAFGKFYTPDRNTIIGQNELFSLASSTLSNQLNSWLSQAVPGFSIGFNWRQSGTGDENGDDYEAIISYQNERWIVNGNVGYRNDNFSSNRFIGDLDVQYILSANGKWRFRGYNRTNDYKQLNPALYTQGVGITYAESFHTMMPYLKTMFHTMTSFFSTKKTTEKSKN